MPRLPRRWQWVEEACYHLMDRGHDREAVCCDDEDRRAFLARVNRYRRRFGWRLRGRPRNEGGNGTDIVHPRFLPVE